MQNKSSDKFTAIALTAGFFAIIIPSNPAAATHLSPYQYCAADLRNVGISVEQAASACSDALDPQQLSACVYYINQETQLAAQDVLPACTRVRRPIELGRCVININNDTRNAAALDVLDNCRRSLLPVRFAECVVGLTRQLEITASTAMNRCISAEDYPTNLSPTFAPPPAPNPTPQFTTPVAPPPGLTPLPNLDADPVIPARPRPVNP